jgi:hypothetical protein
MCGVKVVDVDVDVDVDMVMDLDVDVEYMEDGYVSEMGNLSESVGNAKSVILKFDSGCSRNMSGVSDRLLDSTAPSSAVSVRGFNNSVSFVDSVGLNEDGKMEYYVSNMPSDMVPLSVYDYASDGAAILMKDSEVDKRIMAMLLTGLW